MKQSCPSVWLPEFGLVDLALVLRRLCRGGHDSRKLRIPNVEIQERGDGIVANGMRRLVANSWPAGLLVAQSRLPDSVQLGRSWFTTW